MMPDIFSIFDPQNNIIYTNSPTAYWGAAFLPMLLLCRPTFPILTNILSAQQTAISIPLNQSNQTLTMNMKMLPNFMLALFIWFTMMNLSSMMPYSFNPTSHLIITLPIGLPLWLSLILSSLPSFKKVMASLLPLGAPEWLAIPLIFIETISILFRPITLCFRLAANMSAGHIIYSLLASYMMAAALKPAAISLTMFLVILSGYTMFEFGICVIQAYIFCLLLTLYSNEHPTK